MQFLLRSGWILLFIVLLGGLAEAHAQHGSGRGQHQHMYDPARADTLQGTITAVDTVTGRRGPKHQGLHLRMATEEDTVIVHVAPLFYLRDQGMALHPGDTITVRGARMAEGSPVLIAAELRAKGQSWRLRDAQGRPAWRGHRSP